MTASFKMKGGLNGGTLATALSIGEAGRGRDVARRHALGGDTASSGVADRRSVDHDPTRGCYLA
ncbi:MAG: hypothetical protein AAF552_16530, partial [Pseudomonadota bacterium]